MNRSALLVVDMLKDFFVPKPNLLTPVGIVRLVANNQKACRAAREAGVPVVFVNDSFQKTEIPIDRHFKQSSPHCIIGTAGADVLDELELDEERDYVVPKKLYDGFYNTRLDSILRELDVKNCFVTGTWTNACVQHTVMGAWCRGYDVTVIDDCCSCPEEVEHAHALAYMKKFYGAEKTTLDAWTAGLKGARTTPEARYA
ncbi:MAG: cysteine hydrolase family protein [Hyphomicrobiaceae bacterium]